MNTRTSNFSERPIVALLNGQGYYLNQSVFWESERIWALRRFRSIARKRIFPNSLVRSFWDMTDGSGRASDRQGLGKVLVFLLFCRCFAFFTFITDSSGANVVDIARSASGDFGGFGD